MEAACKKKVEKLSYLINKTTISHFLSQQNAKIIESQIDSEAIWLWSYLHSVSSQLLKRNTKFKVYIQLQIDISECLLTHQNQCVSNKITKNANAKEDWILLFKSSFLLCRQKVSFSSAT